MKRNILLNPGPATTTDTVKQAQVVPDICPREQEFVEIMKQIRTDLVRIVHGDLEEYTSVLFCGSGTISMDVCLNSLLPEGKKILVVNNGAYSSRAVEICEYYGLPFIDLKFPIDARPSLEVIERTLKENEDIALVYTTHNETGTGRNIVKLRQNAGFSVKDLQDIFGFATPNAIYKWQKGMAMPTVDNLIILAAIFGVTVDDIIAVNICSTVGISA